MNKYIIYILILLVPSISYAENECERLYRASEMGKLVEVKALLSSHEGIASCKGKWGYTALHGIVTGHGFLAPEDLAIAKLLIDNGAQVEAKASGGITPLHITPYPEMIELLIKNGANPNAIDDSGASPLIYYAEGDSGSDSIKAVLRLGANPKHKDKNGKTALSIASSRQEPDKIKVLIEHGA